MSALTDLQLRYELALHTARMAIWEASVRDGRVDHGEIFWTCEGAALLGLPDVPFRQHFTFFLNAVHPEDRQYVLQTMQHAADNWQGYDIEYRLTWPDGSIHWLAARAHLQCVKDEPVPRTLGIIWEITELKDLSEKLNMALESAHMLVWESLDANRICLPEEGGRLLGRPGLSHESSLEDFLLLVHEQDRERVRSDMRGAAAGGSYQTEFRVIWPDASVHWLSSKGRVYTNANNVHERTLGLIWDITEQKEAERALAEQKELAEVTLSSIGDGIITVDPEGNTRYLNRIAEQLTGWPADDAFGRPIGEIMQVVDEASGKPLDNLALKCLPAGRSVGESACASIVSRDGRRTGIQDSASPIVSAGGEVLGAVLVIHDVSHERALRHELSWQAAHDPLTGLINRREFDRQLAMALAEAKHGQDHHVLLYLDLDQFKIVNDTCGHVAGDELLRQLTAVLQAKMRGSDIFARLGGDEFAVLLLGCRTDAALHIAEGLRQSVKNFRFVSGHHVFELGASIGVVPLDCDTLSATEAMSAADRACYIAKEQGRNKIHVFQKDDAALAERHGEMLWVSRIASAFREKRFQLYRQPIRSLSGGAGMHNEVLLRMIGRHGEIVPPGAFIPAAERFDQIAGIDRWVVENCLRLLHAKKAAGMEGRTDAGRDSYAINLSGSSLSDESLLRFIDKKFEQYEVDPRSICFEITETAMVRNMTHAKAMMTHFRKMGCEFSLDDFGSGLSSFSYLKNLPVDYLKIDGVFVRDVAVDPVCRAMVASINHVGHVMGIRTIAEFVENDDILDAVREIGLDYAQGYAVGAAQPM